MTRLRKVRWAREIRRRTELAHFGFFAWLQGFVE
jgi:hypothetical protein